MAGAAAMGSNEPEKPPDGWEAAGWVLLPWQLASPLTFAAAVVSLELRGVSALEYVASSCKLRGASNNTTHTRQQALLLVCCATLPPHQSAAAH